MGLQSVLAKIAKREKNLDPEKILENLALKVLLKSDTLQEAFEISKREMEDLYISGYNYYNNAELKDSATIFQWLVVLNPFTVKYWKGYAATYQMSQNFAKALHGYAMASLLEDGNPIFHFHAYECYMALNNREDARKALLMAIERSKDQSPMKKKFEECLSLLKEDR